MAVGWQFTAADVFTQARAFLNDQPNSGVFTDVLLLEYLRAAFDELDVACAESDIPAGLQSEVISSVPALTTEIQHSIFGLPPVLPTGLVLPYYLEESDAGRNEWTPMTPMNWLPEMATAAADDMIQQWAWISGVLKLRPCRKVKDIMIRHLASQGELAVGSVEVGRFIANAKGFLSRKVAAMAAKFVTQDDGRALVLQEEAQNFLDKILTIHVKQNQNRPTRRKPFRASRRGAWRPRTS